MCCSGKNRGMAEETRLLAARNLQLLLIVPPDIVVQGINGAWNDDFQCVETIRASSCPGDNSCPCIQQNNVCVCSPPVTVCLRLYVPVVSMMSLFFVPCLPPTPLTATPMLRYTRTTTSHRPY